MSQDKERRASFAGKFDKRRFEQEVAEEIGISLDRKLGTPTYQARQAASAPGAREAFSEPKDKGKGKDEKKKPK